MLQIFISHAISPTLASLNLPQRHVISGQRRDNADKDKILLAGVFHAVALALSRDHHIALFDRDLPVFSGSLTLKIYLLAVIQKSARPRLARTPTRRRF